MSPKFSLNKADVIKGLTHFGFYLLGAIVVATLSYLKTVDFGQYAAIATLLIGFAGDMANKYIQAN
jgi:hypothetical protein